VIQFELNQKRSRLPLKAKLEKLSKVVFKEFKKSGTISVAIIDSKESKKLNKIYRGKDEPANILTFVYKDEDSLGEIVLSHKEIEKEAKNKKQKITETVIDLIIHGVCHIFEYKHKTKKDALIMEEKERKIKFLWQKVN